MWIPMRDEKSHQQPADAAVAIEEWVNRLELHMRESSS